jgi:hypothetical protein
MLWSRWASIVPIITRALNRKESPMQTPLRDIIIFTVVATEGLALVQDITLSYLLILLFILVI